MLLCSGGGWRLIGRLLSGGLGIGVSGRLDSGCRSYGQGYFACRFRVLVFHAPAHCWTGIERWERPRRGLTHPRGIERSACRIRRWLQYRRFWPCCPEPGFLVIARLFLPDAFAFGLETQPDGSPCTWAAGPAFGGTLLPEAGLPDLLIASVPHLCALGKGVVSLKIADFSGGLAGWPLLLRKAESGGAARFRLAPE